jgi:hypothetical protein
VFTPRTEFGKILWALHRTAVAEAKRRGERGDAEA